MSSDLTVDEAVNSVGNRVALMCIGTLGVAAFLVLPTITAALVDDLGFNMDRVGLISTMQLIGLAAGSLISIVLLHKFNWRTVSRLGLILLAVAELASSLGPSEVVLTVLRAIAGCGGGICVSLATYVLGQTRDKDRNFGLFISFQVSLAVIGTFVFPYISEGFGAYALFFTLFLLALLVLILLTRLVPRGVWSVEAGAVGNTPFQWRLVGFVLLGLILYFMALGAFWSYLGPIGLDYGLTNRQTGVAVSLGLIGGLAGANAAALLGDRWGRGTPMAIAAGLQMLAVAVLFVHMNYILFVGAAIFFCFGWYIYVPYQFALLAAVDSDGRPLMVLNAVLGLGSGLGPAVVTTGLVTGATGIYAFCLIVIALSLTIHLVVTGLMDRVNETPEVQSDINR